MNRCANLKLVDTASSQPSSPSSDPRDSPVPSQRTQDDPLLNDSHFDDLPQYTCLPSTQNDAYRSAIRSAYNHVVHWRPNFFTHPSGTLATQYIGKLAELFQEYASGSAWEDIPMTSAMLLPSLILQRPHRKSKTKEHIACLERRLPLWETAEGIHELLKEGNCIQRHLQTSSRRPQKKNRTKLFTQFMTRGKVKDAIRLLSETQRGGVLKLTDLVNSGSEEEKSVLDILHEKHPKNQPPFPETLVTSTDSEYFSYAIFQALDADAIRRAALHTGGAAGPSGVDAVTWRRWCTCYNTKSAALCRSIASVGQRLCSSYVDPMGLTAFNTCRLIPLDKCPGVRAHRCR